MALKIKCSHGLTIINNKNNITIQYDNVTLEIRSYESIREIIFQMYKDNKKESSPKCFIEILTSRGANFQFEYPYSLRYMMMDDYNELQAHLEKNMTEPENN